MGVKGRACVRVCVCLCMAVTACSWVCGGVNNNIYSTVYPYKFLPHVFCLMRLLPHVSHNTHVTILPEPMSYMRTPLRKWTCKSNILS